jgi:probable F420-dependent oxidoreductase
MQVGVAYPTIEMDGDPHAARRFALAAEDLGYTHLVAYDHVVGAARDNRSPDQSGGYGDRDPFHDPLMMFAYLAGVTSSIHFATGVLILPQRQTVLLAKQAAELAVFSDNRFRLGAGTGWNTFEYQALGEDFHTRGKRMDEQVPLLRRLWSESVVEHHGRFDTLDRVGLVIRPSKPIPIWIGGMSEPAFRRGAHFGDGFMFGAQTKVALEMLERVRHHLKAAGRDEKDFGTELMLITRPDPQAMADAIKRWRDAGGTHACVVTQGHKLGPIDVQIDHIAKVRALLD